MMTADNPQFQNAVMRLRAGFVTSLEEHLTNLTTEAQALAASEEDLSPFARVSAIAHKIHGVAKTLHYAELGQIAAATEHCADRIMAGATDNDSVDEGLDLLIDLIEAITDVCENPDAG